ncbi:Iron uptake system component EfeO precursor [Methyloligella halotolerans]|uniref:Iron uptake system component EfeO n=1 Tax=Methyloligella halotolerans TaxID=1177755 RepID=A0A1E2RXS7_9HYPH|nr:iron uptake system protein EfeO [Methyloligella halotolerans]ODA67023.1 Iron uptake system component EfeO precursor [Methyloligella halotolerans]
MSLTRILCALTFALLLGAGGAQAQSNQASLELVEPLAEYKLYVAEHTASLVEDTKEFVGAIKDGDVEKAKSLFAPTRRNYEKIEPIAELFADLDVSMDSRADDYEKGEADPNFGGFHRIEYVLWEKNTTEGLDKYADKLLADVIELDSRVSELTFPPEIVVGGAAVLMEEVAATKISGEEDRYSRTDLWDFEANFDGSRKIFELFKPLIDDEAFIAKVESNFADVYEVLADYQTEDGGFVSYEKLTDMDRRVLSAKVNTLAEELSTLRGRLGLG